MKNSETGFHNPPSDAGMVLNRLVEVIAEKTTDNFTGSLEIGDAMLEIRTRCIPYLRSVAPVRKVGRPTTDSALIARHLAGNGLAYTRTRVDQLVRAADLVKVLAEMRVAVKPTDERQLRPLTRVDADGVKLAAMWNKAVKLADGKRPTARQVSKIVEQEYPKPAPSEDAETLIWKSWESLLRTLKLIKRMPGHDKNVAEAIGAIEGWVDAARIFNRDEPSAKAQAHADDLIEKLRALAKDQQGKPEGDEAEKKIKLLMTKKTEPPTDWRNAPDGAVMVSAKDIVMPDGTPLEEQLRKAGIRPTKARRRAKGFTVPIEKSPNAIHVSP